MKRSHHRWIFRAALGLVLATYVAVTLHGIANYWQWGHDGYNGAAFWQAARNSLRFGIVGQAQYHTGLTPPPPEVIYTHHPMAVHLHLVVAHALLGSAEWIARLTPVAYSIAGLVMLYLLVARFADGWIALATATIYSLTPLNLVFAKMVGHEVGAIFWLLAFFYAYLDWQERPTRRSLLWALACITAAVQFDWPAYYVSFYVAVHASTRALAMRQQEGVVWNRHTRFLAVFCGVVLANFAAFFGWIHSARGGLEDMGAAYSIRAESPSDYFDVQLARLLDLQGPIIAALFFLWLYMAVRDRGARKLDAVIVAFLFAQLIHWIAFPGAAYAHAYWTYYLDPALAIAGGTAVVAVYRSASARGRRWAVATGMVIAALVLGQGAFAWQKVRWAEQNGHATYHDDYDDQFAEIMWAREVARIFPRPSTAFAVDPSVRRRRIEFDYYLDSPISTDLRQPLPEELAARISHRVHLLDLDHFEVDSATRSYLAHLIDTRRVCIWDGRFVAIDVASTESSTEAFLSEELPASFWWRWLVSLDHPPIRWVPDPEPAAARARLEDAAR